MTFKSKQTHTAPAAELVANAGVPPPPGLGAGFDAERDLGMVRLIESLERTVVGAATVGAGAEDWAMRHPIEPGRARPRILLVDDEPMNIDLLTDMLRGEYEVLSTTGGEHALALAEAELPDLVLLDVMMPGMSGFEVCVRLKQGARTSHIPVIFITCLGYLSAETTGLGLGAIDFITKPIQPTAVLARVSNHLKLKFEQDNLVRLTALDRVLRTNLLEKLYGKAALAN
jgi:PleD family two-component response regulator